MATQYTAKIPFKRVIKIGMWNNQDARQTLASVYSSLVKMYPGKEVYIANGGFFNMVSNWTACWGLKAGGKLLSDGWTSSCFMAMRGPSISFFRQGCQFPVDYTDGVTGYPALIEGGKKSPYFHNLPAGNTDRGRTMLGYNDSCVVLSVIADVAGNSDFTLTEAYNYMMGQGCTYAINLDGGGSSQCNFNGKKITSSRKVHNLVYIIAEPDNTPNPKMEYQKWLNNYYKAGLVIDGSLGKASNKAQIKAMQKECGVTQDGSWGPKSKANYKPLSLGSSNNTTNKIKILQGALMRKNYWSEVPDGLFTNTLANQITLYQRANKITANGIADVQTITSLFK